jgi:hypothetical protein
MASYLNPRFPVEGSWRDRHERGLDDVAKDGQADEEDRGFDRGHAPPDGKAYDQPFVR